MSKEFDYSKMRHVTSVNQTDRKVPYNLRQSANKSRNVNIDKVRKSPYWHLSMSRLLEQQCTIVFTIKRILKPEDGGAMVEYDAIVNHVTMWNVAVERQIQVKGLMQKSLLIM